jgi:hypothetical protein
MADSTSTVIVKADGAVYPSTLFSDNAAAVLAGIGFTWDAARGGFRVQTEAGEKFLLLTDVPQLN